jgi:hypothetical protein
MWTAATLFALIGAVGLPGLVVAGPRDVGGDGAADWG